MSEVEAALDIHLEVLVQAGMEQIMIYMEEMVVAHHLQIDYMVVVVVLELLACPLMQ